MWSIWRYQNEKLWNDASITPQITFSLGYDILWNRTQAQKKAPQGQVSSSCRDADDRWTKPPNPSMKCNVDAALFKESQSIGFGAVMRDSTGGFMVSKTSLTYGMFEAKEVEALALLDAISWTTSFELQDVIFETDSQMVVMRSPRRMSTTQSLTQLFPAAVKLSTYILLSRFNMLEDKQI